MDRSEGHSLLWSGSRLRARSAITGPGRYDAASGSPQELPAFTELQAGEDELAAREAWLEWSERDY